MFEERLSKVLCYMNNVTYKFIITPVILVLMFLLFTVLNPLFIAYNIVFSNGIFDNAVEVMLLGAIVLVIYFYVERGSYTATS